MPTTVRGSPASGPATPPRPPPPPPPPPPPGPAEPGDFRLTHREMPGVDAESGRGLAMVQLLCDELTYERVGDENVWSVRRTRSEPEAP
jgi:hypothetical protein